MGSKSPGASPARSLLALTAIVGLGLALRLWGIRYGLPHPNARPDEDVLLAKVSGFDTGDLNPHWFMYPTFYLYALYGWLKALLAGAYVLGLAPRPGTLADVAREFPARLYVLSRLFSVALGTATVAVTFLLGRAVWNARAGLTAALLLSVAFLHVRDSHFAKPDVALALCTTAALLACVRLERRPSLAAAAVAGVACGLAVAIKYDVSLLVPLVVVAVVAGRAGAIGRVGAATVAVVVTVIAASPYLLLDYRTFAGWMAYARLLAEYGGEGVGTGFWYHWQNSLVRAHGLAFALAAVAALVWNARLRPLLPVTLFLVAAIVRLGVSSLAYTRYFTPLLPAFAVTVAIAIDRVGVALPGGRAVRGAVTAVLLMLVAARPLANTIRFDTLAARPDTRLLARAWLEAHVPPASTILVLGSPWPYTFGDPVLDGYRVRRNPTLDPALGVRWVVTTEHPVPFSQLPAGFGELKPRLRLVATFSPFADGDVAPADAVFEMRDAFYLPLAGFDGMVRGGPVIHVYSVSRDGSGADADG